jgi:hypothetical protein
MKKRYAHIPARRPVFLGCEGESEQAYGQFLNDIVREKGLPFHIEAVNLNPGAGDPLARVKKASQEITRRSQRRTEFQYCALLMDDDQLAVDQHRRQQVETLAARCAISIIWQSPCHEAFLLRHFPGRLKANPPDSATSNANLLQVWPGYQKPMSRLEVSRRIDLEGVERVGGQHKEFAALLRFLRLIV